MRNSDIWTLIIGRLHCLSEIQIWVSDLHVCWLVICTAHQGNRPNDPLVLLSFEKAYLIGLKTLL